MLKARPGLPLRRLIGTARAQRRSQRLLAGSATASAPRVVALLPWQRILAMEEARGRTAVALARDNRAQPMAALDVLRRCAAWLRVLHSAGPPISGTPFGPVARARLDVVISRPGQANVGPGFAVALRSAQEGIARLEGRSVPRVASHGDLHMGNVILSGDGTAWGIDFESSRPLPAVEDLARLLAHFAMIVGPDEPAAMAGFLDRAIEVLRSEGGYGPMIPDRMLRLRTLIEGLVFWRGAADPAVLARPTGRRRFARAEALCGTLIEGSFGATG